MKENKKIETVDIMKGIAIIIIIMVHSVQSFTYINGDVRKFANFGQMGCQMFFLISGFTLCLSWFNKKLKPLDFYKKRFMKIAPGYYIVMLIWIVIYYLLYINFSVVPSILVTDISIKGILINMFFLNGFSINHNNTVFRGGWYIGTIMIFYLLFPLIIKFFEVIKKRKRNIIKFIPIICTVISLIVQIVLYTYKPNIAFYGNNSFMYFSVLNQLPCFLLGIALYYNYDKDKFNNYDNFNILIKFLIFFSLSIWLFYSNVPFAFAIIPYIFGMASYYLFIIIYKFIEEPKKNLKGYIYKIIIKYNKVSYAAFLIHSLVVWCVPFVFIYMFKYFNYNQTLLYFILIIPMYIIIYYLAKYFTKFLNFLECKILKKKQKK